MRRALFVTTAALLLGASAPPDFVGCSCDSGRDGATLPTVAAECVADSDCANDTCEDRRCVSGACVTAAPFLDSDGDGRAPPPCGDDCDDRSASVNPGAGELCDGTDNDCDSEIDEDATAIAGVSYSLSVGDATSVVVPWGRGFLVTELNDSAMWGVPVGPDGTLGVPVELMRLDMGSQFSDSAAAAAADGRVIVATVSDLGFARFAILERMSDGQARTLVGPSAFMAGVRIERIDVTAFGTGFALAGWAQDSADDPPESLYVAPDADAPPIRVTSVDALPFPRGLAAVGDQLVTPTGDRELVLVSRTGAIDAEITAPGDLIVGALASDRDGALAASYSGGSTIDVGRVTPAGVTMLVPVFSNAFSAQGLFLVPLDDVSAIITEGGEILPVGRGMSTTLGLLGGAIRRASSAQPEELIGVLGAIGDGASVLHILRGCGG